MVKRTVTEERVEHTLNVLVKAKPNAEWKALLQRNKKDEYYCNERNVNLALREAPEFSGRFSYDEFRDRILVEKALPGAYEDPLAGLFNGAPAASLLDRHCMDVTDWLQDQGLHNIRRTMVQDCIIAHAQSRVRVNPLTAQLDAAAAGWDHVPRIDDWLAVYCAAHTASEEYLKAVGPKFLIGAVARAYEPGCQMDTTLVLEGSQGTGKTTAVDLLGFGFTRDMSHDLGGREAAQLIQGVWIAELAELGALSRSETLMANAFLTRKIDRYRPPYGRNAIDRPRRTVFIGTTNATSYLNDATGARRFWPVACGKIDVPALREDVLQLWGEAVHRYRAGESWHLDSDRLISVASEEQKERYATTTQEDDVEEWAEKRLAVGITEIEMRDALLEVFNVNTRESFDQAGRLAHHINRALSRTGWVKLKTRGRGPKRRNVWIHPTALPVVPLPSTVVRLHPAKKTTEPTLMRNPHEFDQQVDDEPF